jgi:hypothetical protein
MQRKSYSGRGTKIVKTSITLPEVLVRFAEQQMADKGHPTLSAYLVYLLRRAVEQDEERQLGLGKSSSSTSDYQLHREEQTRLEDKPAPKKKTGT